MAISIKVDEAVQEWMKKKGRTIITVSLRATRTCCVGAVDVDISYKNPQNNTEEHLARYTVEHFLDM